MSHQILPQNARNGQPTAPALAQRLAAAELLIFHCENRKAKSTRRRVYWQRQLDSAWQALAYWQKMAGVR